MASGYDVNAIDVLNVFCACALYITTFLVGNKDTGEEPSLLNSTHLSTTVTYINHSCFQTFQTLRYRETTAYLVQDI